MARAISSEARFRRKRGLVVAFLVVFAIWPLVHRGLVAEYRISPWRLFGWAMYTVPRLDPNVEFLIARGDGRESVAYPENDALYSPRQRRLVRAVWGYSPRQRFVTRRAALGLLEQPDDLAEVLFRARPDLDEVIVVVHDPIFRGRGGRFEVASTEYRYRRAAP